MTAMRLITECLDHFIAFGERHLRYLIDQYVIHFNEERPHQGLNNPIPLVAEPPPETVQVEPHEVVCRCRLGGVLKHYQRKAA
jgi:putative transposase